MQRGNHVLFAVRFSAYDRCTKVLRELRRRSSDSTPCRSSGAAGGATLGTAGG